MTFFHAANSRGKITGEYDYERGRFSLCLETATTALAVLGPYEKSFFAYDDSEENATDKCLHAGPRKPTRLGQEPRGMVPVTFMSCLCHCVSSWWYLRTPIHPTHAFRFDSVPEVGQTLCTGK